MQVMLAAVLLFGYWALLGWLPNPHDYQANLSPDGNLVRVVDRAVLGENHMYTFDPNTNTLSEQTDPEGLLSTLPAIVTALLGYWAGLVIQRKGANGRTVALLAACGMVCFAVGWGWGVWFPISKKLWTSSFVLLTGGLAMVVLAGCVLKFDVWGWRRLARPLRDRRRERDFRLRRVGPGRAIARHRPGRRHLDCTAGSTADCSLPGLPIRNWPRWALRWRPSPFGGSFSGACRGAAGQFGYNKCEITSGGRDFQAGESTEPPCD